MPAAPATFETFQQELARLVDKFDRDYPQFVAANYNEATLRNEFLDPFYRALGWDVGNIHGLIHTEREVDIEVQTATSGRQTRADYVFRIARVERFTCEAKKPAEKLNDRHIYQAKRDAFARGVPFAVLSDFEDLKIFVVGARPHRDEPHVGELKALNFRQYPLAARELWDLLAYESVKGGSLDREIDKLPKRPLRLKGKQGYLIRPDRTKAIDADFLNFLDDARQQLGSDLLKHNDRDNLLTGHRLNEAAQRILDRLIFLRICEDRGIDTGELLSSLFGHWYRQQTEPPKIWRPGRQSHLRFGGGTDGADAVGEEPAGYSARGRVEGTLYRELTDHIRALDQRPASHKPYFNGQLFAAHFSEDLVVGDEWLANFISDLTDEDNGYNFATIKVEILGDAYERFLGKILRPQGRGATIEEKPEVRKAGGVYYTPRYITDYIVEQTIGRVLDGKAPKEVEKLRFVDPACGSGSFLLRAYERVMEHYLRWFIANPAAQKKADCYTDLAGNVRLTTALKRRILVNNIYGVDIDAQAVEVTQLSLYLKMLEDENRDTLRTQTELFRGEPLLPALDKNIRCFNSLIASDFSLDPAELVRVNAGDWDVQFPSIMASGGFDAVVGNPPYRMLQPHNTEQGELDYFRSHYVSAEFKIELFHLFLQRGLGLLGPTSLLGFIVPSTLLNNVYAEKLRRWITDNCKLSTISVSKERVFADADVHTSVFVFERESDARKRQSHLIRTTTNLTEGFVRSPAFDSTTLQKRFLKLPGGVWNVLLNESNAMLVERLQDDFDSLSDVAKINRGLITGDRGKYFANEKKSAKYVPILAGGDVARYAVNGPNEYVLFERPDSAGGCWDKEVHLAPHKILIRQIGTEPTATLIERPIAVTGNIFTAMANSVPQEKFILGILNSKLTEFFWRVMFSDFKSSFPQVTIFSLGQVPIPSGKDHKQHDRLVALVDRMLTLTPALRAAKNDAERAALQNALTKTDRDIDQLVYQLYALTPEEIALVEGTGNPAPSVEAN